MKILHSQSMTYHSWTQGSEQYWNFSPEPCSNGNSYYGTEHIWYNTKILIYTPTVDTVLIS